MKKIKKILAFVLSTSMLLGGMNIQAFAGEQKETNTANTELDNQNEYVVPLTFYGPSGKLLTEEPYSGTVQDYMDNVALVKKNDNGTYHVTLQIENYEKIDILQFSKPGVISDDIAPSNAPMGTFNIPEKYIANNEENPSEATEYLKEQGQINEEWNDKYIQNYSVEKATTGVSWYSFDVDTLEGTMYTKAFYSYGRTDDDLESYMYGIVNGKFTFDVNNAVVAKEINEENYKNIGLELSKVVTSVGDSPDFTGFVAEEKTANDLFSGTCEAKIENGMKEDVKARAELDQAVSDAKNNYAEANYTKDSYENLKAAIKEAEEVLAKSDATVDEMNEQVDKLDKAVKALVRLDDAVDKEDATKAEVQAQVTALQTALDSLRVVDKTNLNALIEKAKAEAAKTDVYESSSLTVLNTAITLAENVAANPKATEAEVAAAEKSLTTALNGLVRLPESLQQRTGDITEKLPSVAYRLMK